MSNKKRKYSKEFKVQAVKMVKEQGLTYNAAAENLGVPNGTIIYRWYTELKKSGDYSFPGEGKLGPEAQKIRDLENELSRTRMERDILKKATAYFASLER